jgi:hypothetical protein
MSKRNAEALALDHVHCRAICDEIGERFSQILKPEASQIPQSLLALLDRLAELEHAPSIVPSMDEMCVPRSPEPYARITRSTDLALPATSCK